jgi:hypothetical protein
VSSTFSKAEMERLRATDRDVEARRRRNNNIVRMRLDLGYPFTKIADIVGLSRQETTRIFHEYRREVHRQRRLDPETHEYMARQVDDYEADMEQLFDILRMEVFGFPELPPDTPAVDKGVMGLMLKALGDRAKRLGLNAPKEQPVVTGTQSDDAPYATELLLSLARMAITDKAINFEGY